MKDAENNRQGKTDKTERSLQDERRIGLIGLLATDKREPETGCPSSEEMALFLEQKLGKKEQQWMLAHLAHCEKCYAEWLTLGNNPLPMKTARRQEKRPTKRISSFRRLATGSGLALAASLVFYLAQHPEITNWSLKISHKDAAGVGQMDSSASQTASAPAVPASIMPAAPLREKADAEKNADRQRAADAQRAAQQYAEARRIGEKEQQETLASMKKAEAISQMQQRAAEATQNRAGRMADAELLTPTAAMIKEFQKNLFILCARPGFEHKHDQSPSSLARTARQLQQLRAAPELDAFFSAVTDYEKGKIDKIILCRQTKDFWQEVTRK